MLVTDPFMNFHDDDAGVRSRSFIDLAITAFLLLFCSTSAYRLLSPRSDSLYPRCGINLKPTTRKYRRTARGNVRKTTRSDLHRTVRDLFLKVHDEGEYTRTVMSSCASCKLLTFVCNSSPTTLLPRCASNCMPC